MPTPDQLDANKEHTVLVKPDGYERGLTGEVIRRIELRLQAQGSQDQDGF